MDIKTLYGIIAAVIGIACFIPYIRDMFRETTKPHIYTWLIWTILQVTGVIAMYNSGAGIGALALAIGAFFCGAICLLSLKLGTKNITVFDTICLTGALAAICVYAFLHQPLLSVILISVIDFAGFLPTLRKAYYEPWTETLSMYMLFTVSGIFSVMALAHYSLVTTFYPLTLIVINTLGTIMIWWRRKEAEPQHNSNTESP